MFDRIARGWELTRQSLAVLRMDTKLLIFPLLSSVACLLVLGSFALPLWNSPMVEAIVGDGDIPQDPLAYAILFAFYAVNYFVIVFFNAALVACAIIRFQGGVPTLADGFRAAINRLPQIVAWALVSATIGVILRAIESRSEKVAQFAAALMGAAWSIGTYFVVPVLVVERTGPVEAVKRSLSILRETWGEAFVTNVGIGFITFVAVILLGVIPVFFGGFLLGTGHTVAGVAIMACGGVGLLGTLLVSSALESIILAAVYLYAKEGQTPQYFSDELFQRAFATK